MSDYLIQHETLLGLVNQARRLGKTDALMSAAEVLELFSKVQGSVVEPSGPLSVKAIDYDGTVLKSANLNSGDIFAIPSPPSHEGLVFKGWVSAVPIKAGAIYPDLTELIVGAVYDTESGALEMDLEITEDGTSFTPPLSLSGLTSIDWGDGTTSTSNGSHTYGMGTYTIKIYGVTYIGGNSLSSNGNTCVTEIRVPSSVKRVGYTAFSGYKKLARISLPPDVEEIGQWAFYYCSELVHVTLPASLTRCTGGNFSGCSSLKSVLVPYGVKSLTDSENSSQNSSEFYGCPLEYMVVPETLEFLAESFGSAEDKSFLYVEDGVCYLKAPSNYYHALVGATPEATEIVISENTVVLSESAMNGGKALTKVTIPSKFKSLPRGFFRSRSTLKEVVWEPRDKEVSDYLFYGCSSLENFDFSNVLTLGESCFMECYLFQTVTIPSTVATIGSRVFDGCKGLVSAVVDSSLLGDQMFVDCSNLKEVTLSDSITFIPYACFKGTAIENIDFAINITGLSTQCFSDCLLLKEVVIPSGVTALGSSVFAGCTALENVVLPKTLTSLTGNPFWGCSKITISLEDGHPTLTKIGDCIVYGGTVFCKSAGATIPADSTIVGLGDYLFYKEGITSVSIPDSVKTIGHNCFYECKSLESVDISSSLEVIENNAFAYCSKLASIIFPNTLKSIEYMAFEYCSSLSVVEIPASVTSIDSYAFYGCSGLIEVHMRGSTPPDISYSSFPYNSDLKIYIPSGSLSGYSSKSYWSDYYARGMLVEE